MPARQLSDGSDDGTSLGQSSGDLISFYGATPVVCRASAVQATTATTRATSTSPYGFTSAQANAILDGYNEIVATLSGLGLWKGGA